MSYCCSYVNCNVIDAKFRCSKCKKTFYCSENHQKLDWKLHKVSCEVNHKPIKDINVENIIKQSENNESESSSNPNNIEKRNCRCMFCGEHLILENEEEAIQHMSVCPLLQEQLKGEGQFTIPTSIQEKLDKSKELNPFETF